VSASSKRLRAIAVLARVAELDRARELAALAVARRTETEARASMSLHLGEVDQLRGSAPLAVGHFAAADRDRARALGASSEASRREHAVASLRMRLRHLEELARYEQAQLARGQERRELTELLDVHMALRRQGSRG